MDLLFSEEAIRWLQQLIGPGHPGPFRLLSLLGDTWGILLAAGLALWRYGRGPGVAVAVAGVLTAPVWLGLATLFAVDRPDGPGILVYEQLEAGAFPSGHVFHAVVIWGVLGALTTFPISLSLVIGAVTGLARVYLGVHYPADVLASLVMAPAFTWLFVMSWRRIDLDPDSWPAAGWITVSLVMAALVTVLVLGPLDPQRLRRWEVVGTLYGGPIALGLHYRWSAVRKEVADRAPLLAALLVLVGLAALSRGLGPSLPWIGAPATAAGLLWIFAGAPATLGSNPDLDP